MSKIGRKRAWLKHNFEYYQQHYNPDLVFGFDFSITSSGCIRVDGDGEIVEKRTIGYSADRMMPKRIGCLYDDFMDFFSDHADPDDKILFAYESINVGKNFNAIKTGMSTLTAAYIAAYNYFDEMPLFLKVAATQLKKAVMGKGEGSKNVIVKEVYKKWGADVENDDLADAYTMTQIAQTVPKVASFFDKACGRSEHDYEKFLLEFEKNRLEHDFDKGMFEVCVSLMLGHRAMKANDYVKYKKIRKKIKNEF